MNERQNKQERAARIIFSALFVLILVGVLAITVWRPKERASYYENRDLARWPEATIESIADGSWFQQVERYCCDHAAVRNTILKLSTWADLNLFHRPVVNDVVVTNDDLLLAYNPYEAVDPAALAYLAGEEADQLARVSRLVEGYGGKFLYAAVPSHYAYFEDRYPWYLNSRSEYTKAQKAAFFSALESRGVPYLDIGSVWEAEGRPDSYMSSVDHHWTLEGALSACRAMASGLNRLAGREVAAFDASALEVSVLPNPYLGSRARKLCAQWPAGERLAYAQPSDPIPFHRWDWSNETEGAASLFAFPSDEWSDVAYTFFMGGDVSETILTTDRPELPSLLICGDSFTNLAETLLYTGFDETRSLDLRHYDAMSLLDYVERYRPEVVLMIRDYEQLVTLTGNGHLAD